MVPEMSPYQLEPEQFPLVRHLFQEPYLAFVMAAVIAGNSPAVIWVDEVTRPQTVLMWDRSHVLHLASTAPSPAPWLHTLLHQTIIPEARGRAIRLFKVYHHTPHWGEPLSTLFAPLSLIPRVRSLFRREQSSAPVGEVAVPAGFTLQAIDAPLLANDDLAHIQDLRHEIASCWPTLDGFLRDGFGFCLLRETELVCWCTAEYVSAGQCGVGIETVEAYQGQGLASAAAQAFVAQVQAQGITAHWDSWQANLPSVAVARKVGFRHVQDYSVHLTFLP